MTKQKWMKLQHGKYTDDKRVKAMWMNLNDGNLLYIKKIGKNYYIDYSGSESILLRTKHHPQDPIRSYKKSIQIAKKFMKKT